MMKTARLWASLLTFSTASFRCVCRRARVFCPGHRGGEREVKHGARIGVAV
jgi:hypothetical protein